MSTHNQATLSEYLRSGHYYLPRPPHVTGHSSHMRCWGQNTRELNTHVGLWVAQGRYNYPLNPWLVPATTSSWINSAEIRGRVGGTGGGWQQGQVMTPTHPYTGVKTFVGKEQFRGYLGYSLPKGLWPSLTSGWPGRNPWVGGAWPDPGPVTTEPPGPNVVCTGVL